MALYHMQEFTLGPLSESFQSQVAANLQTKLQTWPVGCYRQNIHPSPFVLLLNHKVDTHFPSLGGWKAEST